MSGSSVMLIVMVLFGVFGLVMVMVNLLNIRKARASSSWPTVPGKVVFSELRIECRGEDSDRYQADIRYQYEIMGQSYESGRVAIGLRKEVGNRRTAEDIVGRYLAGTEVAVYYNPEDPSKSVLEHGNLKYLVGNILVGLIVIVTALVIIWQKIL